MERPETQNAGLDWHAAGVPISRRYGDPYYSLEDGLAETRHVFLAGNDLPSRFRPGFEIAELGFGTGLNVLAAAACWQAAGIDGDLRITSFEQTPLTPQAMARALAAWPELAFLAPELIAQWSAGLRRIDLPGVRLRVIEGDVESTLPRTDLRADAWFLDGFSPARNPQMWQPELMAEVARRTAPLGTFATYSAAGSVRAALTAAGFTVTRVPGYGRKRHMTRGVLAA